MCYFNCFQPTSTVVNWLIKFCMIYVKNKHIANVNARTNISCKVDVETSQHTILLTTKMSLCSE